MDFSEGSYWERNIYGDSIQFIDYLNGNISHKALRVTRENTIEQPFPRNNNELPIEFLEEEYDSLNNIVLKTNHFGGSRSVQSTINYKDCKIESRKIEILSKDPLIKYRENIEESIKVVFDSDGKPCKIEIYDEKGAKYEEYEVECKKK
jgi:hypothetical protein